MRASDAFENAASRQCLQQRFEMARGNVVTGCERLGRERTPAMNRDVNDGGDSQNAFASKKWHAQHPEMAVRSNP